MAYKRDVVFTEHIFLIAINNRPAESPRDADGFVGNITPAEVRAGKKLKWVHVM